MADALVPLKIGGEEIGSVLIQEDGTLNLTLDTPNVGQEILQLVKNGFVFGLTIIPILNPATDGNLLSRLDHERPLPEVGRFQIEDGRG